MNDNSIPPSESSSRWVPWNKGKLPGAKPPLRPSHVWSIRTKLQLERRTRELALFNLAIDSKHHCRVKRPTSFQPSLSSMSGGHVICDRSRPRLLWRPNLISVPCNLTKEEWREGSS